VVQAAQKSNYDTIDSETSANGEVAVKGLRFRNSNEVVRFDAAGSANGK